MSAVRTTCPYCGVGCGLRAARAADGSYEIRGDPEHPANLGRVSTGLGIKLERVTWGSWHPHKVKLAVSGCPRNCAEATIKDLGVVCVDSGYELHVGGNGGIKIRGTDFLCKVATEEEVIEYCCAYLQLYREEARYLERTAPWIERVGLSHVRERIVDDAKGRQALYARFLESQKYSQTDPWAERAAGKQAEEFAPLRAEPRQELVS